MKRAERWLVIRVNTPSADQAALLAEGLFVFGAEGLQELDGKLITYMPAPTENVEAFIDRLRAQLRESANVDQVQVEWEWQPDQDWAEEWKRGLAPRRVGRKLIIAPSWTTPEPNTGDIVITIDPQMAFGTGEHASTRGALRLLEGSVRSGDRAIDVGAGSAVLAIAAAKLGAHSVLAVELDEDAVINARENIDGNQVSNLVRLECRAVDDAYMNEAGSFDLILANILSSVIIPLLPAFLRALEKDGRLIVAGILQSEADPFIEAARQRGFTVQQEDREEEWWSALLVPTGS